MPCKMPGTSTRVPRKPWRNKVEEAEEISDAMEDEAVDKIATAEEIQNGISTMVSTLEAVRIRPHAESAEPAQASKKVKTVHPEGGQPAPGFGAGALHPFGAPGK